MFDDLFQDMRDSNDMSMRNLHEGIAYALENGFFDRQKNIREWTLAEDGKNEYDYKKQRFIRARNVFYDEKTQRYLKQDEVPAEMILPPIIKKEVEILSLDRKATV